MTELLLALHLAFSGPAAATTDTPTVREDVEAIVSDMTLEGMDVGLVFTKCGYVNAYYWPEYDTVVFCEEALEQGRGFARFVAAHEMTHAIIDQYSIPYTGSEEDAADELAAIALEPEDVLEASLWFRRRGFPEDPRDSHSSNARRAWNLACLADGADERPVLEECAYKYQHALWSWARLLSLPRPK